MIITGYHLTLNIFNNSVIMDYEKADSMELNIYIYFWSISFCTVYHNVNYCFYSNYFLTSV